MREFIEQEKATRGHRVYRGLWKAIDALRRNLSTSYGLRLIANLCMRARHAVPLHERETPCATLYAHCEKQAYVHTNLHAEGYGMPVTPGGTRGIRVCRGLQKAIDALRRNLNTSYGLTGRDLSKGRPGRPRKRPRGKQVYVPPIPRIPPRIRDRPVRKLCYVSGMHRIHES